MIALAKVTVTYILVSASAGRDMLVMTALCSTCSSQPTALVMGLVGPQANASAIWDTLAIRATNVPALVVATKRMECVMGGAVFAETDGGENLAISVHALGNVISLAVATQ